MPVGHVKMPIPPILEEFPMAKAYMVVTYRSLSDPKALDAYAKLAGPAVQA
jgi:hypothetical protein